ncbi:uncharacterized protein LOC131858990 [Cryptomeria japonica]|uniref:uncharacterized protein LOC131858990 n=1 Tax=Cryptomeria japonica TaxID=3369 RepID=UPI0027DA949C|nr:uncharacterized protein LOC131858990 [Cryptomeria japonica]
MVRLLKAVQGGGSKITIDFPIYHGKMDSEEVLGWIDALENYFEYEDMNEDKKVKFAKTKLRGTSLTWWSSVQTERVERGMTKITTWNRMKAMMKDQFLPSDYAIQTKRLRQNLKQKDMDVMTYTKKFHKLSIRGGLEDEDEKVSRYLNGLGYTLQDEIGLSIPKTLGECFQLAIRVEEKRGGYKGGGRFGSGRGSGVFTGRCFTCNEVGHTFFKCPMNEQGGKKTKKRVQLAQGEEQPAEEKVGIAAPELEGSFDNLVSQEMVDKLNLVRIPHNRPYKATWVTDEQNIVVQEQAYVEFTIGDYHDRVLCDIIPMTCCHVLLGRPWQYQRRTLHDGFLNTYVVHKDGKKFTLNPLKNNQIFESSVICFGRKEYVSMQVPNVKGTQGSDQGCGKKSERQQHSVTDSKRKVQTSVMVGTIECPLCV